MTLFTFQDRERKVQAVLICSICSAATRVLHQWRSVLRSQSPGGLREERAMVHFPHNQWFDRIAVVSAAGTLTRNLPHLTAVR